MTTENVISLSINSYTIIRRLYFLKKNSNLKVSVDDATFLLGTRDSVPMEHCSKLSQGNVSAPTNA